MDKINGQNEFEESIKYFKKRNIIENYGDNSIKEIKNISIYKTILSQLNLKQCKINNSKIKQSYICNNSYLRHTKFENIDFTGTTFENTNLEKATFTNCNLNYVKFENCILDYKSILKCKPKEPNLDLILLKSLYKNELNQGNIKEANEIRLLYKKEERKLYLSFLKTKKDNNQNYQNTEYYKDEIKRQNLTKGKVIYKLITSYLDYLIWGHGSKVKHLLFTMALFIFVFATIYSLMINENFANTIIISSKCLFLNNNYNYKNTVTYVMLIENLFGLINLGLLTSIVYKKASH